MSSEEENSFSVQRQKVGRAKKYKNEEEIKIISRITQNDDYKLIKNLNTHISIV